jgi:Type II secretion system (T2SS), protein E, N-terminal domain
MSHDEPTDSNERPRFDADLLRAQHLALKYCCEFIDLRNFQLPLMVLKSIPVELMFRYNFVPTGITSDGRIAIVIADPSQLMLIDEISLLLGKRIVVQVGTLVQISEVLRKLERSNGVDETPGSAAQLSSDDPFGSIGPSAPVRSPLKPKPRPRSGGAKALPEEEL